MGPTAFDDRFAGLSRRDRVGFVGALLAARGWDVELDAPVIRATSGDEHRVVAVARDGLFPGDGLPSGPVDVVVGVDSERTERLATARGARAWDACSLYDMARHGLDPAVTDRLFGEFFDATSEAVGRPTRPGDVGGDGVDTGQSGSADRPRADVGQSEAAASAVAGRTGQWLIVLFVAVVVVGGGALAAQALTGLPSADAMADGDGVGGSAGVDDGTASTPLPTATPTPAPRQVLPGLTTAGITDTAILARGHAAALTGRSFTLSLTYTEQAGGETLGWAREVVRVENRTVYRSTGSQSGDLGSDLVPIIVRDLYADGEGRYLRQEDGALRVGGADDPGTGQVVERSRALVAWYLSGDESTLVDTSSRRGTVYYRVDIEGTTDSRAENYRATGLVSEQGLVVRVDARYRLPDDNRTATVSLRYANVGNTTVARPDWMPPGNGNGNGNENGNENENGSESER